jgi:hypothetical protein
MNEQALVSWPLQAPYAGAVPPLGQSATCCPPGFAVSIYSDRGGCFGRFCPGVSRAQRSSPLIHGFALFASPPLTPTIPNSGFDG